MMMKKRAVIFIFFLLTFSRVVAQAPTWNVIESNYQYTMTFVAKLNIDGVQLKNTNDLVGAFVGTTCRGVSGLTYVASEKTYFAYLTVFSNTPNEAISFQVYDSSKNKVTRVSKTINFLAQQHIGNLFQSYSIAEPALNNKAEIISYNFFNINSISSIISPGSVKVSISESYPLANLKPVYVLSNGANLFKNRVLQSSGTGFLSFVTPVTYEVLSEDESTLSNYTVEVTPTPDPPLFYKKDAVCSTPGAIRVRSKREGAIVQLSYNGKNKESKQIVAGEAIFTDLLIGTYVATIGTVNKVIIINHKVK
jgi:hypothetical protein